MTGVDLRDVVLLKDLMSLKTVEHDFGGGHCNLEEDILLELLCAQGSTMGEDSASKSTEGWLTVFWSSVFPALPWFTVVLLLSPSEFAVILATRDLV